MPRSVVAEKNSRVVRERARLGAVDAVVGHRLVDISTEDTLPRIRAGVSYTEAHVPMLVFDRQRVLASERDAQILATAALDRNRRRHGDTGRENYRESQWAGCGISEVRLSNQEQHSCAKYWIGRRIVVIQPCARANDRIVVERTPRDAQTWREVVFVGLDQRVRITGLSCLDDIDVILRQQFTNQTERAVRHDDARGCGIE